MGSKPLKAALARAAEHVPGQVLPATDRFIGEGFDNARLDTVFLTMPVSWRSIIAQYVGRLHRLHEQKQDVRVHDYADLDVPMLARMFDKRCRGYEAVGYSISLPASAAPGWPVGIALSADGSWKHRYGASLRRLLRDGVDEPLADLFTQVAREIPAGAQGAECARSASEAFLFRRLQSLPETCDRFRVNERLPIPFSEDGRLEVDFLDPVSKLVLEVDGSQHLADREAYRRDRRKDAVLQEHGYLVLRFLAEDLGTRLDAVLDEVLQALARRRPGFRQHPKHPPRVVLALEHQYRVVGIADLERPSPQPRLHIVLEPLVQHFMQIDVAQRRGNHTPLRGPPLRIAQLARLHHAGVQPLPYRSSYHSVSHPSVQKVPQVPPIHASEEVFDVQVYHPATSEFHQPSPQRIQRLVRATPRPESVRAFQKVLLVHRLQHHQHRALQNLVG